MKKNIKFDLHEMLDSWSGKIVGWLDDNKFRLFAFAFLALVLVLASYLPYLNLIFTKNLTLFLILATLFFVFRLNWKFIICFCFGLFLLSYLFVSLGFLQNAELIGNYIYGFLVIAIVGFFTTI